LTLRLDQAQNIARFNDRVSLSSCEVECAMEWLLLLSAGSFLLRLFSGSVCREAAAALQSAARNCKFVHEEAVAEHRACVEECYDLAVNRQGAIGFHYTRVDVLLKSNGVSGGLFVNSQQVFRQRSEQEVRTAIERSQALFLPKNVALRTVATMTTGAAVMIQGVAYLDQMSLINVPIANTSLHSAATALHLDSAVGALDSAGVLGGLSVADFLGGALSLVSVGFSIASLKKTKDFREATSHLNREAWRFKAKRDATIAIRKRVQSLHCELESDSYALFKWTLVAEEAARIRRASNRSTDGVTGLPTWILSGIRRAAAQLWLCLQKPALS
jgi:hypothetical protein